MFQVIQCVLTPGVAAAQHFHKIASNVTEDWQISHFVLGIVSPIFII